MTNQPNVWRLAAPVISSKCIILLFSHRFKIVEKIKALAFDEMLLFWGKSMHIQSSSESRFGMSMFA